jgi:hypothetical protein
VIAGGGGGVNIDIFLDYIIIKVCCQLFIICEVDVKWPCGDDVKTSSQLG